MPPMIHAAKNRDVSPAAPATMAGVRKMPMPTTRLNTTIAVSKVDSRAWITLCSATMQGLGQQPRELLELIDAVVELGRDAQHRYRMRMKPGFDAALAEPVVQSLGVEAGCR